MTHHQQPTGPADATGTTGPSGPSGMLHDAATQLRDIAPLIGGSLGALADPIADWLDSLTGIDHTEHGPESEEMTHALRVARAILGRP